jgi:hypothetical protein
MIRINEPKQQVTSQNGFVRILLTSCDFTGLQTSFHEFFWLC